MHRLPIFALVLLSPFVLARKAPAGSVNVLTGQNEPSARRSEFARKPFVLHAFDANALSEPYNSARAPSRDTSGAAIKFQAPMVANGKVHFATSTESDVYGPRPCGRH
jgi:hypothetical protein